MIIKKENRVVHKNSDKCIAYEYPFEDKTMNVAYIEIEGRYPDSGRTMNKESKEIIHVISGTGKVLVEDITYEASEGDQVYVPNNVKFHFENCNNFKIAVVCAPAWAVEQYQHFDD